MASSARMVTLVTIKNMNRALKFYTKTLGAKMGDRGRGAMKDMWASAKLGGAELWFIAPEKFEKRELAYMTLLTSNIKRYVANLRKKGVKFEKAEAMGPETKQL